MPTFNSFLSDYEAALPPYTAGLCLSIPRLVPLIVGSLQLRAYDVLYTADSAYGAIQGIREMQVSVITGIPILDATYRLLDNALNGTIYSEDVPGTIEPEIPAFPPGNVLEYSILGMLEKLPQLYKLSDNFMQGNVYPGEFEDDRNIKQQLDDILAALAAGDPLSDDQLAVLEQIRDYIGAP